MNPKVFPKTAAEWSERINATGRPSTADDQSRTWDGRVLDTKEKVLVFLSEMEVARKEGAQPRTPLTDSSEGPALDVERILRALSRHHVNYLVLGGTAASAYGAERVTVDFDCLSVRVVALEDVIASKEWADRPKDHDALPELRELRRTQIMLD